MSTPIVPYYSVSVLHHPCVYTETFSFSHSQVAMASFPHKLRLPDSKLQVPNTLPQAAALEIEIFRKLAEKKHLLRAIEIAILCFRTSSVRGGRC